MHAFQGADTCPYLCSFAATTLSSGHPHIWSKQLHSALQLVSQPPTFITKSISDYLPEALLLCAP